MRRCITSSDEKEAPHYFFRKKWSSSLFLQEKNKAPHYLLKTNEAPHYFFRKKWSTSLFLQKKMKCFIISSEHMRLLMTSEHRMRLLIIFIKKHLIFYLGNNEIEGMMRSLIFYEEIMRSFIFFWRNNEAPHFFLKR